jgi:nucleotidyltransferase substrate binding protein (TIGR01987 family)
MDEQDIRWKQRFSNYEKALNQFKRFIANENLNDLEKQGLIQSFEYTHELAWNLMKDFLQYEGIQNLLGSRSTTREAFNKGIISNGQIWMNMIESRNKTVYIYEENILNEELNKIINDYFPLFDELYNYFKKQL